MKKRAFTLIEITVTIAIFAIATVALSQSFINGLFIKEKLASPQNLPDKHKYALTKILYMATSLDSLSQGGSLSFPDSQTIYQWTADPAPSPSESSGLFSFTLNVSSSLKKESFSSPLLIFRPDWIPPSTPAPPSNPTKQP